VATDPTQLQAAPGDAKRRPAQRARIAAACILGALAAAFAILNTGDVEVNWILGSWSTPLIIVIAVSFLVGVAADRLSVVRSRRRASD
jgi:uncharacterized integral membrane protein